MSAAREEAIRDPRFTYDEHGRKTGLNWSRITPERPSEPTLRASLPKSTSPRTKVKHSKAEVSAKSLANLTYVPERRFDYQQIADLWAQGLTQPEIMEKVGCGQNTVRMALQEIRPEGYTGKSGPRPIDRCKRDHDMSVYGKVYNKSGTRTCTKCKSDRDRAAYERKKQREAQS